MGTTRKGAGARRRKMGRPAGPPEKRRRNLIRAMVTDAELDKLERMADDKQLPVSTLVYEIVSRALKRRK